MNTPKLSIFILTLVALSLSGCAMLERTLFDRNEHVEQALVLSEDGTVIGTNLMTNVVVVVKPSVATTLGTAQTVNRVANPTPTGPLVELGLTAVIGALGWYAKRKSTEAKKQSQASSLIIQAIEKTSTPEAKAVKDAIAKLSRESGLSDFIHSKVKTVTARKGT